MLHADDISVVAEAEEKLTKLDLEMNTSETIIIIFHKNSKEITTNINVNGTTSKCVKVYVSRHRVVLRRINT